MARTSTTAKTAATSTKRSALERKALAESNKSAGMRMLFEDGYTVAQVRTVFSAPYGYVYGVAQRAGFSETAAERRAPRKATKATTAKAAKPTQAKVSATRAPKSTRVVAAPANRRATRSKAAPAKAAGRPTAARRAANRKPSTRA